jgi:hypothetical protein
MDMPNTQTETLVFHKYPEEEPEDLKDGKSILLSVKGAKTAEEASFLLKDERGYHFILFNGNYVPPEQIVAWAHLPQGWRGDEHA